MPEKNCSILFDQNEYGTYTTGQIVTGRVIITFNKPKKIRGIKLQIGGYAACRWREIRGKIRPYPDVKKPKNHVYYGREDYIASTTFLVGSDNGSNFTMDAGTYAYTFACPIPINCPSSFEGTYGHVRYMTKVTFLRAGASNRTHAVGFTVLKLLDLNQESKLLRAPANNEAMENFCFFHTSKVDLQVNLTQTGFVPGQFILVSAKVNNSSGIDCKRLLILLNLRATYTADIPSLRTTHEKICLVKKICAPVPSHSEKTFAETLRVPATPPTSEHLCKVLRVSYEICVVAVMSHLMINPKTKIPITIGNTPLMIAECSTPNSIMDDVPTTSMAALDLTDDDGADGGDGDDYSLLEDDLTQERQNLELPPPTYEEAMFMSTDLADDDVNTVSDTARFTPRFPVYDVDNMMEANAISPPPNKPQKRRRRRRRRNPETQPQMEMTVEKPSIESPVQI